MTYASREYYSSLYGEITEKEFERQLSRAEIKIDTVTHGRVGDYLEGYVPDEATAYQRRVYRQIQGTMCDLIHSLMVQETAGMGEGIASVSNDGYSESYKITTSAEKEAQLLCIIKAGLSGTGLAGAL